MSFASIEEIVRDLEANPVERNGHVYHRIPFPEFDHLQTSADAAGFERKLEFVQSVLARRMERGLPHDRVLDIGANAGLFAFTLAKRVNSVTAYEPHERYGPIGESLARLRAANVDWHPRAFTMDDIRERWDIALLLSTFQWMTRGDEQMDEGRQTLRALSRNVSCLVFELGFNSGKSAITTKRLNHIAAVYRLLRTSTDYPHIRLVGSSKLWHGGGWRQGWRYTFVCSHDDPAVPEVWYAPLKHLSI